MIMGFLLTGFVTVTLILTQDFVLSPLHAVAASDEKTSVEGLQSQIDKRSAELDQLQKEREELERGLAEINKAQNALQQDIKRNNYTVRQLDLSIKSSRVIIDKLGLEAESLREEIENIETAMGERKKTIGKLVFELDERDRDGFLVLFLRNQTLADSFSEVQTLFNLNNDLTVSIDELKDFRADLIRKAAFIGEKQNAQEEERKNLEYRQAILADEKVNKQLLLKQTKFEETGYEKRIAELEKQQLEISRVINAFEHQLRATFDPDLLPLARPGVLEYPVANPIITQKYGDTEFASRAYRTKFHSGTDFGTGIGTPVFAAESGMASRIGDNDTGQSRWQKYQYGKYIMLDHGNNLSSLYAHLSRATISAGEKVERGQIIGYSGNTGYSTGPHLHFGVYWTPSVNYKNIPPAAGLVPLGVTIDPQKYL